MSFNIQVNLDPASLAKLAELENYPIRLASHIMDGLGRSAEAVQGEAELFMWAEFKRPMGRIEGSLQNQINTPTEAQVWTEEPYGRRLNEGFSGRTDALGRFFLEWPKGAYAKGYHWAEAAIEQSETTIQAIFMAELEAAGNGI